MGLAIMIVGLAVFLGAHTLTTMRPQRAALVARVGEVPYKVAYSVVSLVAIGLIGYGFARYRAAGMIDVWDPPRWLRHVNNLLLWPAIVCVAAAYIPGDIRTFLKHPMLVAVKIWALGHLLANGDLVAVLLFGTFLAWAVLDRISVKRRGDAGPMPGPIKWDVAAVVIGLGFYALFAFVLHEWLIGVPVIA